jgi:hypothetical protein
VEHPEAEVKEAGRLELAEVLPAVLREREETEAMVVLGVRQSVLEIREIRREVAVRAVDLPQTLIKTEAMELLDKLSCRTAFC